jgi:N-dimethylarginine dimethylaminohydrolase
MERIMCAPTYFDIVYSINPWMDTNNRVNKEEAFNQWYRLIGLLASMGDTIRFVEPEDGWYDMTFSGDAGLVWNNTYIPSNFRNKERRGEVRTYLEWFQDHGYEILRMPEEIIFEGLGDVVFHEGLAFFGYGSRSDERALEYLYKFIPELKVLGRMEIVDDHYFHLAMALSFIDENTVLYYPPAFTKESVDNLKKVIPNAIAVSQEDADKYFACNNLVIGDKVILDNATDQLRKDLKSAGYETVTSNMSEFKKSGGSLRCLVLSFMTGGK